MMDTSRILAIESVVRADRSEVCGLAIGNPQQRSWCTTLGAPGAGKTTLLGSLVKRNPSVKVFGSALSEVADLQSPLRHYFETAFGGATSYFLHFQMEMLMKRIVQSLAASRMGGLVDGSICSTYAYSRALLATGCLTIDEYRTFYSWYLLARVEVGYPPYLIYCHCSTEELILRVEQRARDHEAQRYSLEYIEALNCSFAEVAAEYRRNSFVITVDTETSSSLEPEVEKLLVNECQYNKSANSSSRDNQK